jgi:hypothetical protein
LSKEASILKEKIENELTKLTDLEEKISKEMKESFIKQHENLTKIEKELNNDLIKKVTVIKDKLENFISESIEIIKGNEKINKYTQYFEKNREKSNPDIIKTLSYISEIENNNQKVFHFINESMINMNINFNENTNTLEYIDYYFNGISSPINIQLNGENNNIINISWKIDEQFKILGKAYQSKFNIEIIDKNNNIYEFEGKETNIEIRNLIYNEVYEFRIRTIYNNEKGIWSEKKKILKNRYSNFGVFGGAEQNNDLQVYGVAFKNKDNYNNNNLFQNNYNIKKSFTPWKKIN